MEQEQVKVELGDYRKICSEVDPGDDVSKEELQKFLLSEIAENSEVNISTDMVTKETDNLLKKMEDWMRQQGKNIQEYLNDQDLTLEELRDELSKEARDRLETEFVLKEIAETEGIEASQNELNEEISRVSYHYQISQEEAKNKLEEQGDIETLRQKIIFEKTLNYIMDLYKDY